MNQPITALEGLGSLWQEVQEGKRIICLEGFSGGGKAFFLAWLFRRAKRPVLVLTPEPAAAGELYEDLAFFLNPPEEKWINDESERGLFSPETAAGWTQDTYLFLDEGPSPTNPSLEVIGSRLEVLEHLWFGRKIVAVASMVAALRRVLARRTLKEMTTFLEVKDFQGRERLVERALERGYHRVDLVDNRGEFAVRGGIFDIFSPGYSNPLRIELDDDRIESIREFDPASQKSLRLLERARILPMCEFFPGQKGGGETIFDYLPENGLIVMDDAPSIHPKAQKFWKRIQEDLQDPSNNGGRAKDPSSLYLEEEELQLYLEEFQQLRLFPLGLTDGEQEQEGIHSVASGPAGYYQGRFPDLARQMRLWQREGHNLRLVCLSRGQAFRLKSLLEEYGVESTFASGPVFIRMLEEVLTSAAPKCPFPIRISVGRLSAGFLLPDLKVVVLVEDEIFGMRRRRPPTRQARRDVFLSDFADLKTNDYVVHVDHGIGQYLGITKVETGGIGREFLEIEYAGGDKLYVPLDRLNLVQKYIGGDSTTPALDKLGHSAWKKVKEKIRGSLRELARELLRLYAGRQVSPGCAFSPDNHLHREFDALFEYEETPHQLQAIQDVKADMEQPQSMDRLVCGDVGYGKTEVAMRATFKAVMDGKQVAILVPTTILAQQHLQTFRRRFSPYPIRVEALSRFRSPQEHKAILRGLKDGSIHIVIGTHRLLQKDVQFKDLGLLVIDEEQRFGVTHKEKLKQLRKNVDALTLTATPIPRTLYLSLVGIRNISIIETPPEARLPIQTYVRRFSDGVIQEAILRELGRDGQVFFVHNRVENIEAMRKYLQHLIPQAKIAVAHGQMKEQDLEEIMLRFLDKEFNVLLSTSIIESGLDIPSVNTILINRADHFGLAQLYQLRGRVGRDRYQAYAYLLIPEEDLTSESAKKRLRALKELSALGSGFQLASKDMEIRGAGNILGHQQSGQRMSAVGFELYCQLLEESIRELKGEFTEGEEIDPEILLNLEGYIPEEYIANVNQRLDVYKRLSSIKDLEDILRIKEEIEDRYGAPPGAMERLLRLMAIKVLARKLRILKIERDGEGVVLSFSPNVTLIPFERFEKEEGELTLLREHGLRLKLKEDGEDCALDHVKAALMGLMEYVTI